MAQVTNRDRSELAAHSLAASLLAAGNTTLLELPTKGLTNVGVQVDVTVQALDAFLIQGKFNANGAFVTLYSAAGNFTTPAGLIINASGDLTAQAAGTTGWFLMDVRGLYAIKVLASAAVDGALVDAYAGGS